MVVVHGGAGHIPKEKSESAKKGVCAAARAGYDVLRGGGSSMDAVVEAVMQLENNSLFNAGNITPDSKLQSDDLNTSTDYTDMLKSHLRMWVRAQH